MSQRLQLLFNSKFSEMFRGRGRFVPRKWVGRVIEEIRRMRSIARLYSVHFSDDLFTADSEWVLDFCGRYRAGFPEEKFINI